MMCPWAARIGARRSLRPVSGALVDPVRPPERLDRISRAAPSKVAAPRTPARGRRLRSEGTDNAMRRTWSALRSIQVVVCLVLNVIEALVHPRHPPSASRSAPASWPSSTMLLEMLLEKLLLEAPAPPPPGAAGFLIPCFDIFFV